MRLDRYLPGGVLVETTVIPDPPAEVVNADLLETKALQAIDILESADNGWATLTAAQKDAATRLAVRVAAKLARLSVGRLEAS